MLGDILRRTKILKREAFKKTSVEDEEKMFHLLSVRVLNT